MIHPGKESLDIRNECPSLDNRNGRTEHTPKHREPVEAHGVTPSAGFSNETPLLTAWSIMS